MKTNTDKFNDKCNQGYNGDLKNFYFVIIKVNSMHWNIPYSEDKPY